MQHRWNHWVAGIHCIQSRCRHFRLSLLLIAQKFFIKSLICYGQRNKGSGHQWLCDQPKTSSNGINKLVHLLQKFIGKKENISMNEVIIQTLQKQYNLIWNASTLDKAWLSDTVVGPDIFTRIWLQRDVFSVTKGSEWLSCGFKYTTVTQDLNSGGV